MSQLVRKDGGDVRPIDLAQALVEEVIKINDFLDRAIPTATPGLVAEYYKRLRHLHDRVKDIDKNIRGILEPLQTKVIPELFEKNKIKSQTTEDGYRIGVSQRVYASIKADMKPMAFEWLRSNDYGNVIYETVNAQTLGSIAKDIMSQNKEMPEEVFNVALIPTVSMTKT